jgi:drug/metabolite transporter (DMT)-like permease
MMQHHHQSTRRQHVLSALLIVGLTAIWGSTFVVMKRELGGISPGMLMFLRFAIGAVVLLPFLRRNAETWRMGAELGLWLWAGYWTQVVGLQYTSVNRSAFITSLSVIFVPMIAAACGRRVPLAVWVAAALAVVGVGLLSYDGSAPNRGDVWTLATALSYGIFFLRLERAAQRAEPLPLTAVAMLTVTALSLAWLAVERPQIGPVPWGAIVYLGLVATAISTSLQTVAQKHVPAPEAGVIFTLEPVFASAFAYLFFGDLLGARGWAGAGLIIVSALLCQWPAATNDPAAEVPHEEESDASREPVG